MTAERIILPQISFSNLVQLIAEAWRGEERCSDALIIQQPLHHQHLLLRETPHLLLLKPPSLAYHWLIRKKDGCLPVNQLSTAFEGGRPKTRARRSLTCTHTHQTHELRLREGLRVCSCGTKAGSKVRIGLSWREHSLFTHTKGPICISVPTTLLSCLPPQRW